MEHFKKFLHMFLLMIIFLVARQNVNGKELSKDIQDQMETVNEKVNNLLQAQKASIEKTDHQDETIATLEQELKQLSLQRRKDKPSLQTHVAYGCQLDVLTLACAVDKTIDVTTAYYGQYSEACSTECCLPGTEDCIELLETTAPGDWMILLASCNNKTMCQVQNPGRDLQSCPDPKDSNYVIVYFNCLPEDVVEPEPLFDPVAFTAWASTPRYYDSANMVLQFDSVITNVGEGYSPSTNQFTCPTHGLYVFFTAVAADYGHFMSGEITKEGSPLVAAMGDETFFHQGSNMVVIECNEGERVWVRTLYSEDNRNFSDNDRRYSTFSGYLLHAYD